MGAEFIPQLDEGDLATHMFMKPGTSLSEVTKAVSYTHLRAHETVLDLVCRLLLEKKKKTRTIKHIQNTKDINKSFQHTNITTAQKACIPRII